MAYNQAGTHHKMTLLVSPQEYADFIEMADAYRVPLKTLMMRMMNNAVKHHKAKNKNAE